MPNTFQTGEVVQLKSGGPKMTVTYVGADAVGQPSADCTWFDGTKQMQGTFPQDALEIAKPGKIGRAVPDED